MIRVPYEQMKFRYITNHYDYHLEGTCWYNGRIAKFRSQDETDYQKMNDTCPCCKVDGTDNWEDCHCENAPDVFCYITELSFVDRCRARLAVYRVLMRFIRQYGLTNGLIYWARWKY